ncbi:hypothetical protein D3C76_693550 [compost metagenome]
MNTDVKMHVDLSEHPKEWNRRIEKLEKALSTQDPTIINLKRAYSKFKNMRAIVSDEMDVCKNALYDAWYKANEAHEKKIEKRNDTMRWRLSISLSALALIFSIISISTNTYFQQKNYEINKQRFELSENIHQENN